MSKQYVELCSIQREILEINVFFSEANYAKCLDLLVTSKERILQDGTLDQEGWYFLRLGQCLMELGNTEESKKALEKVFDIGGFEILSDAEHRYTGLIQDYVDSRVRLYRRVSRLMIATLIGVFMLMFLFESGRMDGFGFSEHWVIGCSVVFFISTMIVASSVSPYGRGRSSTKYVETGELGPVD